MICKKNIFLGILLLTILFLTQEAYALVMGPDRFECRLPPGEIADADYYVQNNEAQTVHIKIEPENWYKDIYNYRDLDIKDWIEFDTYEFELKPKEIKKLRLRIKVPTDLKGELVSQIFFTSSVYTESGQPAQGLSVRLGAILLVAIKGTEIVDAEITGLNISKAAENDREILKLETLVRNKGNVHQNPTGSVLIQDATGAKIVELDIQKGRASLPNQETAYTAVWAKPELKNGGKYRALATIKYGKEYETEKIVNYERAFEIGKNGEIIIK